MSNSLNPVFGEWYTDRQLGAGTDGKVFSIYREKYDGSRETSVLKIIRLGENRNERKIFDVNETAEQEFDNDYERIISNIKKNVKTVMKTDGGKHFIKYEDFELRKASDGKGRLILIKLEEGRSLADLLKELSFTLDETIRLGINICNSLIKCRSFGYIYPNLKPENILFDKSGRCKLGDFGTFSCLEPSKTSVAYKRTQYYMAPEFIKTGNVNCTVDTYSLGLILYMLTNRNRLPFTEPYPENVTINSLNTATQMRVSGHEISKPALASDDLWRIIRKACSFNINERYFTPNQMLSDLKNALENKPFEDAVYDEIYSVAPVQDENEEAIVIPEIDEILESKEEITPVLSLKEEITIPEITAVYKSDMPVQKKRPVKYAQLPEIKKRKNKNFEDIKKLIILGVISALLLILLIVSIIMRFNDNNSEVTNLIINYINIFSGGYGGADLWLLI